VPGGRTCPSGWFTECFSEGYGRERSRLRKGKTGGPGLHPVTCRLLTSAHSILPRLSCLYDPPRQGESQVTDCLINLATYMLSAASVRMYQMQVVFRLVALYASRLAFSSVAGGHTCAVRRHEAGREDMARPIVFLPSQYLTNLPRPGNGPTFYPYSAHMVIGHFRA
jgi:hypothetical protein